MPLLADPQVDNPKRFFLHTSQKVLGGIKLHLQSDSLDNISILAFLPPLPFLTSAPWDHLPNKILIHNPLSQAQLSRGEPTIGKITFLCNHNKSQGPMRLGLGKKSNTQSSKQ